MRNFKLQIPNLDRLTVFFGFRLRLLTVLFLFLFIAAAEVFFTLQNASAQNQTRVRVLPATPFRIGERLTYNISFEKFNNAGYAEIYTVSRGKLGERDAVELRAKIKTNDLVSAFYLLDESRTTFASAETGLPLYIRKTSNAAVLPKETIYNYTVVPTLNSDLLTLIYKARIAGGVGNFTMQEDEKIYNVSLQNAPIGKGKTESGKIKTDAGEFETSVASVESEYLTEKGITNLRINFSQDEAHIPVLIQFKTAKGNFRALIASIQIIEPEVSSEQPSPAPIQVPKPQITPRPIATPTPYIENEPLLPELAFALGETLEYRVSTNGQFLGLVTLQAKERRQFAGLDSLLLTATVTETQPGQQVLVLNDGIKAQVNPDSLAPQQIELKFTGVLSSFNTLAKFDQRTGFATYNKANRVEVPVGTHSLLSLAYAIRSFNLKPSKDPNNPVNDTRVAVFLDTRAYVFTLRPSNADLITLQGEKVSAQQISISTGTPAIDSLNLRLWLSNDEKRLPLRLVAGAYQADLITEKQLPPTSTISP